MNAQIEILVTELSIVQKNYNMLVNIVKSNSLHVNKTNIV